MALTARQTRFYTDTVDIWARPGDGVDIPKDSNKQALNLVYAGSSTPDQTAVKCMLQTQMEGNNYIGPLGRTAFDNIFTLDRLFLAQDVPIQDQDVVRVKTSGHPLLDPLFIVSAEGTAREIRCV